MGDRNLIQLKKRDMWHYWNFGSMMPICGAGEPDPTMPGYPKFTKSMHASFDNKKRNVCPVCLAIEVEQVKGGK